MTIDEIKAELKARGMTQQQLADELKMNPASLRRVLSGNANLTDTLAAHISLLLTHPREAIAVYRINIPEARVEEICCNCATDAERQAAIDALLHHNLLWLASIGAQLDWSDEERQYLGLPPA